MTPEQQAALNSLFRDSYREKNFDMAETARLRGADIFAKDKDGDNFIHLAVQGSQDIDIVKFLIKAGVPVDEKNNKGRTPLHDAVAAQPVSKDLVRLLIDHGADPLAQDGAGSVVLAEFRTSARKNENSRAYYAQILDIIVQAIPLAEAQPSPAQTHHKKLDAMISAARDTTQPAPQLKIPRNDTDVPEQDRRPS